jgi:hypothetical protein
MRARLLIFSAFVIGCVGGFTKPVAHYSTTRDPSVMWSKDFTAASLPSGATCSRTGSAAYPARSAVTYASVATDTCIYEDHGDNTPGGWWVHPAFSNSTAPFTLSGGNWGDFNTTLSAAGSVTCPDGTTGNASKITSTNGSYSNHYWEGTDNSKTMWACMWVRDDAGDPPTNPLFGIQQLSNGLVTVTATKAGSGNSWRRVCRPSLGASYSDVNHVGIIPSTDGAIWHGQAGSIDVCGVSIHEDYEFTGGADRAYAQSDLPMISTSTGAQIVSLDSATASTLLDGGNLDVAVSFVPAIPRPSDWDLDTGDGSQPMYFFRVNTPEGELSLRWANISAGEFILRARGADIITAGSNTGMAFPNAYSALTDLASAACNAGCTSNQYASHEAPGYVAQEMTARVWYQPSTGSAGFRITINGATQIDTTAATTGSITAPSGVSAYLLSDGTTKILPGRVTKFTVYKQGYYATAPIAKIVAMGDSLMRSNPRYPSIPGFIYTANEIRAGKPTTAVLALGGDTCEGQQTAFSSSSYHDNANVRVIIDQCGINNIGAGDSSATLITKIQSNITYYKAHNATAKIVRGCITPAWAYWNTSGGSAYADAKDAIRVAVNTAIQDGTITGIDTVVCGYNTDLTDTDGKSLKAKYCYNTLSGLTGGCDGIHYTDIGRANVLAPAYRTALNALGF